MSMEIVVLLQLKSKREDKKLNNSIFEYYCSLDEVEFLINLYLPLAIYEDLGSASGDERYNDIKNSFKLFLKENASTVLDDLGKSPDNKLRYLYSVRNGVFQKKV